MLATIPAPGDGGDSGLAWAEGTLWVGQHRGRKIHQIDPETGAILRTIESDRFVTGVTWIDGELWHGTWEGDESEVRRIDPETGEVLERLEMPAGAGVSGLESDGGDRFFCGGGSSGKVRAIVDRSAAVNAAAAGTSNETQVMMTTDLSDIYRNYIACLNKQDWPNLGRFIHDDVHYNAERIGLSGYGAMLERDFRAIPISISTSIF